MVVGYARVSTQEQNEARQLLMFKENGVEKWFIDKASGKNTNREELKSMLEYVREGDTLVVESISRLGRSTRDLLDIVQKLADKGVIFKSLKEALDTSTPSGKFVLTVFAAIAELDRENILLRQAEGIAIAKANGVYKGRKPIEVDQKKFDSVCKEWKSGAITAREAMRKTGLTTSTFYRRVKERAGIGGCDNRH